MLLYASKETVIRFRLDGCSEEIAEKANNAKAEDRVPLLAENGCAFVFDGMKNRQFENNLRIIDSKLPVILAGALLSYYSGSDDGTLKNAVRTLEEKDPLGFGIKGFYRFKIQDFLSSVALGMVPTVPWEGYEEAMGGYLAIRTGRGGKRILVDRAEFGDSLLDLSYFEIPSGEDILQVYESGGKFCVDLGLQIELLGTSGTSDIKAKERRSEECPE